VRSDLPCGLQAAQLVHAAGESSPGNLHAGTHAVVLAVPDELALVREADRLEKAGVQLTRIYEPDAPYHGALMALGLVPGRREDLRRHLSCLPLLR
jgi:hypothetical protein